MASPERVVRKDSLVDVDSPMQGTPTTRQLQLFELRSPDVAFVVEEMVETGIPSALPQIYYGDSNILSFTPHVYEERGPPVEILTIHRTKESVRAVSEHSDRCLQLMDQRMAGSNAGRVMGTSRGNARTAMSAWTRCGSERADQPPLSTLDTQSTSTR